MKIIKRDLLDKFAQKHARARSSIAQWVTNVKAARWSNLAEVKQTYGSADQTNTGFVIFNIGGNTFRIITRINFEQQQVFIRDVMTHAEYDKWKP